MGASGVGRGRKKSTIQKGDNNRFGVSVLPFWRKYCTNNRRKGGFTCVSLHRFVQDA